MNLKPKEKSALLAGQFPAIIRTREEIEAGEEIILKTRNDHGETIPEFSIRISGRSKNENGSYQAVYVVQDNRRLYLNQGIGYTRSPARALDAEAPILDPAVIEAYAVEAQQANALLQGEAARRQKVESKESSIASSPRSQRAKERHLRALEAA